MSLSLYTSLPKYYLKIRIFSHHFYGIFNDGIGSVAIFVGAVFTFLKNGLTVIYF